MRATLKNILLIISFSWASLLSNVTYAMWENNWLLGLSGGYLERKVPIDIDTSFPDFVLASVSHQQVDNGYIGGLLGGYQARCRDWLLGVEANIEFQEVNRDQNFAFTDRLNTGFNGHASYSQRNIVALTGRFGYEIIPNLLPYVRLGIQSSRDKLIVAAVSSDLTDNADLEIIRRVYRLTGGFGVEMPICYLFGLSARAEYNFRSKGSAITADALASDNQTAVSASARPKSQAVLFSLVMNFV